MNIHKKNLPKAILDYDPELKKIFLKKRGLEETRKLFRSYVNRKDEWWHAERSKVHPLELITIEDCMETLRNILWKRNEEMTGFSTLGRLLEVMRGDAPAEKHRGFLLEVAHLAAGAAGRADIYQERETDPSRLKGRKAAVFRSGQLDRLARYVERMTGRYQSGLDPEIIHHRTRMQKKIRKYFRVSEKEWTDYRWHLRHILTDPGTISKLVGLHPRERRAMEIAREYHVPFGITPYYLGLFEEKPLSGFDRAVRAQVIPPPDETRVLAEGRATDAGSLDFMLESDTSPEELITRRYPQIAILKPVNTCPQICSYCQRNWEVEPPMFPGAFARKSTIEKALAWFEDHRGVTEVLITGGDPLLLADRKLEDVMRRFARMKHIRRIRLGTRFPVTLPFRVTDAFADMLARFHEPGGREVAVVTHFEHVAEITPEAVEALSRIRKRGIAVYNQTVYTFFNSRRFENVALRKLLRLSGVDPYYTFNTKGKEEQQTYRVPIARLLQEVKEEARLVPGMDRTDEPVFNIPGLGKNYLKAGQHHAVIGIHPDGSRMIEFHPWEKKIKRAETYVFKDIPIYHYLLRLEEAGEDPGEYRTIWYYY